MKNLSKLSFVLLFTLGIYSNSFGQGTPTPPAGYSILYRMYNSSTAKHLLAGQTEADNLTSYGGTPWVNEGKIGFLNNSLGVPIYRFYRNGYGHYFSTNSSAPSGYISEGLIGYGNTSAGMVLPYPPIGVHCYVRIKGGSGHFYTTNYSELGGGNSTWRYEGVAFYLYNIAGY